MIRVIVNHDMFIIPKISSRHQNIIDHYNDYVLGDISTFTLEDIMFYTEYKKQNDVLDKSNDLAMNGYDFLKNILNDNFYVYSNKLNTKNTILCSILYCISQYFALLKNQEAIDRFIVDFRIQMAIDIVEKGYTKSLNLVTHKIKRKLVEEVLLRSADTIPKKQDDEVVEYDLDRINDIEFNQIVKYICLRFNIGLTIIRCDKTFQEIIRIPDRLNIVLLSKDNKYSVLCDKNSSNYLHKSTVLDEILGNLKKQFIHLKPIKEYKVLELKEIAQKYGISHSGLKKDELYTKLVENLTG